MAECFVCERRVVDPESTRMMQELRAYLQAPRPLPISNAVSRYYGLYKADGPDAAFVEGAFVVVCDACVERAESAPERAMHAYPLAWLATHVIGR